MCGVFGVSNIPNAAQQVYMGLCALQHRGQESAGIITVDDDNVAHAHRSMGLVADIFSTEILDSMPGSVGIGHTRYSTTGSSVISNAQPCAVDYHTGPSR